MIADDTVRPDCHFCGGRIARRDEVLTGRWDDPERLDDRVAAHSHCAAKARGAWDAGEQARVAGEHVIEEVTGFPDLEAPDGWPDPPDPAAYHGVLGDIAQAVAPHTEGDPVGLLGTMITMFGAACGPSRSFYQGSRQRANLSIILVGETGFRGRKGTTLGIGRAVFDLAYRDLAEHWLVGVASGEAIPGYLKRHEDPIVLIVEPEFGRVLTIMGRDGNTLSDNLRNAWDGVPLGYGRSREDALVSDHHVSLLGHITPVELRERLSSVDAANGFANRLLMLAVRRSRLIPFPSSPDDIIRPMVDPLRWAIEEAQTPGVLEFTRSARARWIEFYAQLAQEPRLGLAGAVTARHEAQVARLALVYALADRSSAVDVTHLEAAVALAEYARRSAVWALGDSTGNRHADVLRRHLADGDITWLEARELTGRRGADLEAAVAVLVEARLAEVHSIPRQGGGRPARVIRPTKVDKVAKGTGGGVRP